MLLMKEELHTQNYPSRTTKNIQNMAYSTSAYYPSFKLEHFAFNKIPKI